MNDFLFRLFTLILLVSCISLASCSSKERQMEEPLVFPTQENRGRWTPPADKPQESIELSAAFFDFDKAVLLPAAKASLRKNAAFLRKNPTAHLQIEGRCDERGTQDYNVTLGAKRAEAAKNYLISLGISPKRLSTVSYGAVPGSSESARAKNRNASPVVVFTDR